MTVEDVLSVVSVNTGTDEANDELIKRVRRILPKDKYGPISRMEQEEGTRRAKFFGTWGKERKVCHKVDKPVKGPHAVNLREKGYNTKRDIETLLGFDPVEAAEHRISPLLDFNEEEGLVISTEPLYEGAVSLGRFFAEKKPTRREFESIFGDVISAVKYANEHGVYHRDLNNNGIMVAREGGSLRARVTDWEVAVGADSVSDKPHTTVGSRSLRDPLLDVEGAVYGSHAEMYQIAMNALSVLTGETLEEKDDASIKTAMKKIPRDIRKRHGGWIKNCLAQDKRFRPSDLSALANQFDKACKPGFFESIFRNSEVTGPVAIASAIGTFALVASLGYINWDKVNEGAAEYAKALSNREKYQVSAVWDGSNLEIKNNLFELEMTARVGNEKFPEKDFVVVDPIEKYISVDLKAYEMPREKGKYSSSYSLDGQLYIEGHKWKDGNVVEEFRIYPRNPDRSTEYGRGSMHYGAWLHLELPEDLPEGSHNVVAEIYAPSNDEIKDDHLGEEVSFKNEGKAIARQRIPLVVGKPEHLVDLGEMRNTYPSMQFDFRDLVQDREHFIRGDTPSPNGNYFMASPLDGHLTFSEHGGYMRTLDPDKAENDGPRVYFFASYDSNGDRISYTGVPFARECINCNSVTRGHPESAPDVYQWNVEFPDRGFAQELLDYSARIDQDFRATKTSSSQAEDDSSE